jgi:hypothetical protein
MNSKRESYIGTELGKLKIVALSENPNKFVCECTCGKRLEVYCSNILHGGSRSCGAPACQVKRARNRGNAAWRALGY